MKDMKSLRFEVWSDFPSDERNPPREMVSIRGDFEEGAPGMRYIWFVLTSTEFQNLLSGKQTTAEDGYYKLTVHGDSWTFCNMESLSCMNKKAGEATVPYYKAEMPLTFMKSVFRLCKKTWKLLAKGYRENVAAKGNKYDLPTRIQIEVSQEHRDRVTRLYGQGLGNVVTDFGDWKPEQTISAWTLANEFGGDSFNRCVERITCIARNQTWGFHQTATVRIGKDGDDFYWEAVAPNGRRVMNGGLINHGRRDGKQDWATHT